MLKTRAGPEGAVVLKTRAGPEGAVVLKTRSGLCNGINQNPCHTRLMKNLKLGSLLVLVSLVSGLVSAAAVRVPLELSGTFRWEGKAATGVKLQLSRVTRLAGNQLLLEGTGEYGEDCTVRFTGRINRLTLAYTQVETLLRCKEGSVNGQYRGTFSSNLKSLKATWFERTGEQGTLILNASSSGYILVGEIGK